MPFKTARILHLTVTRRLLRNQPRSRRVIEAPVSYISLVPLAYDDFANILISVGLYGPAIADLRQGKH